MLLAAARPWAVVTPAPGGVPLPGREVTGSELVPAIPALGLVMLAGVVAVVAARGRLRAAVGGLLALAGGAVVALGLRFLLEPPPEVAGPTGWWALAAAGGAMGVAAGVAVVMLGRSWPAMSGRYERARSRPVSSGGPADAWDAMDRGEDPTDGPPRSGRPGPG